MRTCKNLSAAFLIIFFSGFSVTTFAQADSQQVKINIQLRPRAELRNGLFTPILKGQQAAAFVSQRSRLGILYSKNQKLKLGFSAQVVNVWGNDPQVQPTASDVSLYEAWAQLYFNPDWSVKIGRQVFSYDDERILGSLDWNNAGRKHDAVLLGFEKNKLKAHLAAAYSQNAEKVTNTFFDNSASQPYKGMEFLWMKYQFSNALGVSVLGINLDMQNRLDSSVAHLQTVGTNIYFKKNQFNFTATYYYQTGRNSLKNSFSIKTNAWMAAVKAGYDFNRDFGIGAGSDYLSGRDMNSNSSTITFFNPLYGTHHKFYGFMDYFYAGNPHNNVGISDSYLNFSVNSSKRLSWQLVLHHFESAARVIDYTGSRAGSSLGNEADLTFGYNIMSGVRLFGGYSQMFTNTSMKYVKNISASQTMKPVQNWLWLSINVNPDILLLKFK
jgi:hypothetical protein